MPTYGKLTNRIPEEGGSPYVLIRMIHSLLFLEMLNAPAFLWVFVKLWKITKKKFIEEYLDVAT